MSKQNCLPPIITGEENVLLGSGKVEHPILSPPFSQRRQENQGNTNRCVFYIWAEILENKVYWKDGRWYRVPEDEITRLWNKSKKNGLASESNGAYLNAPLKMMEDGTIVTMVDQVSGDTIQVEQAGWYVVANRSMTREKYNNNILNEIALNAGVMSGVNTKQAKLGYLEADKTPFIVQRKSSPRSISHATALTEYNFRQFPNLVVSSGTWGEKFGKEGIVYYNLDDLWRLFTPLGFTINILTK